MNRWTSADPAGLIDGPNVYAYVGGNPVQHIDNLGAWYDDVIRDGINLFSTDWCSLASCLKKWAKPINNKILRVKSCYSICWCFFDAGLLRHGVQLLECERLCTEGGSIINI